MSSTDLQIAVASDSRYLTGAIGTLSSIRLSVSRETAIKVFFLHDGLTATEQQRVHTAMAKLKCGPEVEFVKVDDMFASFPSFRHGSTMTYARLVLPDNMTVERLIYVDVDILVLKDLSELLRMDVPETGVGGVVEGFIARDMPMDLPVPPDPQRPYLNAGLLMMDLPKIRSAGTFAKAFEMLHNFPKSCKQHDQSALNYVLNGDAKVLDEEWNVQSGQMYFDPIDAIPKLVERSLNVHFVTKAKPWLTGVPFPAEHMFRMLLDAVDPLWREDPFVKTSMARSVERMAWAMPLLFKARAWSRKLTGKPSFWDFYESKRWSRYNENVLRLDVRSDKFQSLVAGWQAQINANLTGKADILEAKSKEPLIHRASSRFPISWRWLQCFERTGRLLCRGAQQL